MAFKLLKTKMEKIFFNNHVTHYQSEPDRKFWMFLSSIKIIIKRFNEMF